MKTENKLVQKYALPYYIWATVFFGVAGTTIFITHKHSAENAEFAERYPDEQQESPIDLLAVLLVVGCIFFGYFGFRVIPNMGRKKAMALTHRYINETIQKNPKLKQYAAVLNDDELLEKLTAIACNGLSEDVQKQIIRIAKKFDDIDANSKQEEGKIINAIDEEIIKVVKQYAVKDATYAQKIQNALANLHKTYFLNSYQKAR